MQPKAINPYRKAEEAHKNALDFISNNLPPDPTFENLNDILGGAIFTPDPTNPTIGDLANLFLGTILPFAYNGYVNGGLDTNIKYTDNQLVIANQILKGISTVPVENIADFLRNMDETIASSKLTYDEQAPLYLTTACAKADYEYWMAQIASPGSWAAYIDSDKAINYMHLPGIVSAAAQGALLTFGFVKPPQIQLLDIFSAVVGSIGLAAGKVVFGWVPYPPMPPKAASPSL